MAAVSRDWWLFLRPVVAKLSRWWVQPQVPRDGDAGGMFRDQQIAWPAWGAMGSEAQEDMRGRIREDFISQFEV